MENTKLVSIDTKKLPVVCAWYTDDYQEHAETLETDLKRAGVEYHLARISQRDISWEAMTRVFKPRMVLDFMAKFPSRSILLIDADARVSGTAEDFNALLNINTDVALRFSGKISRSRGTTKLHPWSGTMLFNSTCNASEFVEAWAECSVDAPSLATDEATLGKALTMVPGLTVTMLDEEFCAGAGIRKAVIRHPYRTGQRSKFRMLKLFFERIGLV